MDFNTVKIQEGQSLLDIAIQEYGTTESIFVIIQDNELSSIDVTLNPGDELKVRVDDDVMDRDVRSYLKKNDIKINNGEVLVHGLGTWTIPTPGSPPPLLPFVIQ